MATRLEGLRLRRAAQNDIAVAREAVDIARLQELRAARRNVALLLGQHGLFTASFASRRALELGDGLGAGSDYRRMLSWIGRFHAERLAGRVAL